MKASALGRLATRILALFLAVSLVGVVPAEAGTTTINCYPASQDADGDGYANGAAVAVAVTVDTSKTMVCPSGYVNYDTDCDDTNANRHPFRDEIAFNGIDDNCDGRVDETQFEYSATGNGNTTSGFAMKAIVNDASILAASANLYVEVELASLHSSAYPTTLPRTRVTDLGPGYPFTTVAVSGLTGTTPYRARLRFFKPVFPPPLGAYGGVVTKIAPTYVQVGGESDWYYTTTDGDGSISKARTKILLKGIKEYDESNRGRVGYRGTVKRDGTRYGASTNEKWCSEFYVWVTKPFLQYTFFGFTLSPTTVEGVVSFYELYGDYHAASEILTLGKRGDYMPADTDGDGSQNHSTMFLAVDYSSSPARVWTLEGNSGNRVVIRTRTTASELMFGLGHIESDMVK
jgi:hypothetical protein